MSFIWPKLLILLFLVPLFVIVYLRLQQRRVRLAAQLHGLGFGQEAAARDAGIRRHIPPAFFLVGLTVLLIALARPQAAVSLPRVEGTVLLVFDVSGSMAAEDLPPTRLEAAKEVALDFVSKQPSTVRIGVIAFSNNGFAVQPPTTETEKITGAISRIEPQLGTSIAQGLIASLNTIDADAGKASRPEGETASLSGSTQDQESANRSTVIILLTDGENTEGPDPIAAAQEAAARGVRVYTIGIGTAAGTVLTVNGFTVHTRLDEQSLQQIAQITGGQYFNAQNKEELRSIYNDLTPQLVIRPEDIEITSIFAGAGIIFLLTGGLFSFLWFNRLP